MDSGLGLSRKAIICVLMAHREVLTKEVKDKPIMAFRLVSCHGHVVNCFQS